MATIPELRSLAIESGVRMIACQMTMDLFEYKLEDMVEGIELGGATVHVLPQLGIEAAVEIRVAAVGGKICQRSIEVGDTDADFVQSAGAPLGHT